MLWHSEAPADELAHHLIFIAITHYVLWGEPPTHNRSVLMSTCLVLACSLGPTLAPACLHLSSSVLLRCRSPRGGALFVLPRPVLVASTHQFIPPKSKRLLKPTRSVRWCALATNWSQHPRCARERAGRVEAFSCSHAGLKLLRASFLQTLAQLPRWCFADLSQV